MYKLETYKKYFPLLFTLFFISILFSSCSPKRYLKNYMLSSFGGMADLYMTEGDLQLVRESMPATLKLLEAFIAQSPENPDLLVSAAQGFTVYAYAFVYQDAERIMMTDIKKSIQLKKRAHRLYLRAKSYAFQALEIKYPGFKKIYFKNPESALKMVKKEDVVLLYWVAAAWAGAISVAKDDPVELIELPHIGYLLDRALDLNESYDNGILHELMISYSLVRPDAGRNALQMAKKHYKRAEELSKGEKASVYVSYAENIAVTTQNREEFLTYLNRALSVNADAYPLRRLANAIAQDRAKWLKENVDEFFF